MKQRHALAALLVLCACRAPFARTDDGPVIAADDVDNAWDYLAAKYDRDGDGRVTEAEYTRTGGEFAKLDRNEDGVLDTTDYPAQSAPSMGRNFDDIPADVKKRMGDKYAARAVLLTYWQPDPAGDGLHRHTMLAMFAQLDSDQSDDLDESEFACATDARPWGGPGRAWPLMLAAADAPGDGDGRLGRAELIEYHGQFADDEGFARGAPSGSVRVGDQATASDGAPVGHLAPDFALQPVGGGDPVRLSDFRHIQPVALIFGSYT